MKTDYDLDAASLHQRLVNVLIVLMVFSAGAWFAQHLEYAITFLGVVLDRVLLAR